MAMRPDDSLFVAALVGSATTFAWLLSMVR
jgi:hypothetical protein